MLLQILSPNSRLRLFYSSSACTKPRSSQVHNFGLKYYSSHARAGPIDPVDLDYLEQIPENGNNTEGALVILHGLFGSKRNWSSLSKVFSRHLGVPVYALDLRNHGSSPHALPMSYTAMATDVMHFIEKKNLSKISLLGHSMGGKVAMTLALNPSLPPSVLQNLIVADIAPVPAHLSSEFLLYIKAMKRIETMRLRTRKEAEKVLTEYEKVCRADANVVLFLLTNILMPHSELNREAYIRFRFPLKVMEDAITEIGSFPYAPNETTWEGRTLFIKGKRSKFINHNYHQTMEDFFPRMTMETLDAGHWVTPSRPNEFTQLVKTFITGE
ncbi:alpha/beta-hydrolase [Lentinula aciculospora]|uniref:Alpha/beta-hydrolase n=1 Tax=Lentinula aciculospora TaxID=153920 RepID=A0A9W9DXT1_9AGAR|nr:alpha/beta-hydrolase [Lentinula aciculospora]